MARINATLDSSLSGENVATVADQNTNGGIPLIYRIVTPTAAGTINTVVKDKIRIIDVWFVKTTAAGGAGAVLTVSEAANAITDALDLNVADKIIVRAAEIDDAEHEIPAGGTLRVVTASGTDHAGECYVQAIRVA